MFLSSADIVMKYGQLSAIRKCQQVSHVVAMQLLRVVATLYGMSGARDCLQVSYMKPCSSRSTAVCSGS